MVARQPTGLTPRASDRLGFVWSWQGGLVVAAESSINAVP
jgi:hypothetical protein